VNTQFRRAAVPCCGLSLTEAVEDTLKTIFKTAGRGEAVTTGALAEALQVTAPTVSTMLKRLESHGLVDRGPQHSVWLTGHGADHARHVVRRHRLLETFLLRVLQVPWDEVHAEAEVLEHAVSDRLLARIDAHLDHPGADPHGDPIPPPAGGHDEGWGERLDGVAPGAVFRVDRVLDRDDAALRHLADLGITPGRVVQVTRRDPFGGPLWVRIEGRDQALGDVLAALVHGTVVRSVRDAS
jgi:DtxR family transcriptional regulator, Mn-dependent transcriptional regulator